LIFAGLCLLLWLRPAGTEQPGPRENPCVLRLSVVPRRSGWTSCAASPLSPPLCGCANRLSYSMLRRSRSARTPQAGRGIADRREHMPQAFTLARKARRGRMTPAGWRNKNLSPAPGLCYHGRKAGKENRARGRDPSRHS